jgi:hypothetical protein
VLNLGRPSYVLCPLNHKLSHRLSQSALSKKICLRKMHHKGKLLLAQKVFEKSANVCDTCLYALELTSSQMSSTKWVLALTH